MDIDALELPDPCQQACPWLQESWEAAGVRVDVPDVGVHTTDETVAGQTLPQR